MKALVTGSAGFVGRHMMAELNSRGYDVFGIDPAHPESPKVDALDLFRHDATVYDLVVHAAATAPYRMAIDNAPLNLVYDTHLDAAMFDWAVRTEQRHVVYLSSSAAYPVKLQARGIQHRLREGDIDLGRPELGDAAYGTVKLMGERMAREVDRSGLPVTVVRPFSGYGEDQGENWPFGAFIGRALRREDPFTVWGDGTQTRDWMHIDDVVGAVLALVEERVYGPVNLCTGRATTMLEMIEETCRQVGYSPTIERKLDAPEGVHFRVGSPDLLLQYYQPQISVEEGIARALKARGA